MATLTAGTLLRHTRQPDWGVGEVVSIKSANGAHDVVVAFEAAGERRLKLKDLSLLAPLTQAELDERAAQEAAAAQAAQAERKARSKRMKATTLKPFAQLGCTGVACVDVGDGTVAFNGASTLVFADADGNIVDELERPQAGASARYLDVATDGTLAGWSDLDDSVVIARRGECAVKLWRHSARMWHPKVEAVAGVGAVVTYDDEIRIVRHDLGAELVALPLRGRKLDRDSVRWWNHDLLLQTYVEAADWTDPDWRRFHCVGGDGAVRFEGPGLLPVPVDDERFLVCDHRALRIFDRDGVARAQLDLAVQGPDTLRGRLDPFVRVDDDRGVGDLVMATSHDDGGGLVRFDPSSSSSETLVRWHVQIPAGLTAYSNHPVRVGRFIALACGSFEGEERQVIVVVDASDGALVHQIDVRDEIVSLVAAGDDAVAAVTNAKRSYAWAALSSSTPKPLLLAHGNYCHAMCSPKPGVLACLAGHDVSFHRLDG